MRRFVLACGGPLRFGFSLACLLLITGCTEVITEGNATGPVIVVDGQQVRHGIWVTRYKDGARQSHGRYTRGTATGLHRTWHPNGQLATERRYDWDGRMHELQVDFDSNGERIDKRFFTHGEEGKGKRAEKDKHED